MNLIKCLKSFTTVLAISIIGLSACKKDGNPNKLPNADNREFADRINNGVIKVLAIGNSFSENALESNFYDLAKASGKKVIVGNLFIAGASLDLHKKNALGQLYAYEYRKIDETGTKKTYKPFSIDVALLDEPWDYISFQQASPESGLLPTVQAALPDLYNYVKSKSKNPGAKYVYHSTWAYAPVTTNTGFANYNNNQLTMYNAIVNVAQNVNTISPIDMIVPTGTAIQNARTSQLGESFTVADGYHLNTLGKYVAACTWYEKIFGVSVVGNTYTGGLSDFEVKVAQNAAHFAVLKPFEITSMSSFEADPVQLTKPVLIDFGNATPSPSWNQMSGFTVGSRINLKDSLNAFVGISITVIERFNNINTNGATNTTTPMNMPSNVSARNFFGNAAGVFGGLTTPQGVFELRGLLPSLTYNFSFFGSRDATDNRETKYTVAGMNQGSGTLNPSSNSTAIATINNIRPTADGKLTITVTAGPNNVSANKWFYINAAKITSN
ncbi:DUF4886 domain-containing protein [Aridibaculum aurantiacum]|uniref:DUF4886 domain-containing protein n=1 Tax=Aridibaculum aurantiacum TaxID=2810307 RepID=UPI001A966A7D|nr:DUF4886 domain-containing protein [Aridibaculum aurantiacum]